MRVKFVKELIIYLFRKLNLKTLLKKIKVELIELIKR